MDKTIPIFRNVHEEVKFYKELAAEYQEKAKLAQQDLEEFQESSRELESELEAQLEQSEHRIKELRATNSRLQKECDSAQSKLEALSVTSNRQITELQDCLSDERKAADEMHKYIREIEQKNDDLERLNRATICSLEDFETRVNMAIERNVFLENELDEKDALSSMVQRLKDEARDLKQELSIYQTQKGPTSAYRTPRKDSNTGRTPDKENPPFPMGCQNTPLTPSARISALNIVGDLLRRVGALEAKLASCRNFSKEGAQKSEKEEASPVPVKTPNSEKKHASRGNSVSVSSDQIPLVA